MESKYDHQKFEQEIYKKWEDSGAFKPGNGKKPFCIIMPPPNANASLHAGHGMYTVEDILIRWKRMQGYSVLWLPGMDHAGFETQFVYEKNLAKQGKSRLDFDRQTLYQNIFQFVKDNSGLIYQQFRRLGFSADWERSVFSLDKHVLDYVFDTFAKMAKERLVYRGDYMVNYCTHCGTSLAELEVLHEERVDPLYYIKYGPFVLATVRPETKFGDTALAVHPDDKRYKKWIGKEIEVEGLLGKFKLNVIADEHVDPKFGTGVVKITPYHDPNDFEVWKRHPNLPSPKRVIDLDGKLTDIAGKYAGLRIAAARKTVAEDLQKAGLLDKVDEKYIHVVSVCYKCKRPLEPAVIPNWFVSVAPLKPAVIDAAAKNKVKFHPGRYKQQFLSWMEIMHDWPISRQIAWGIRIPAWYDVSKNPDIHVVFLDKSGKSVVGTTKELLATYPFTEIEQGLQSLSAPNDATYVISEKKPGKDFLQETDTFDTWFSSGQWPLVTMSKEEERLRFPSDVMGTLSEILKFWVSRMMMFSLYRKEKIPFKHVYLWSMVTDAKGQKMSKSKGNVVNPIDFVDKYGADAFRMSLLYGVAPGSAVPLSEDKVRGMRNFSNKIWNAARFVVSKGPTLNSQGRTLSDNKFLEKLDTVVKAVTKQLEDYRLGLAAETVYNEFWHWFCDEAIEKNKKQEISDQAIFEGLTTFLKLLHPFVPFVTEAIWGELGNKKMLITSQWPK